MTREEILAFLARRQSAFVRRDVAALTADHAEDGLLESPAGGTVQGRAAIEKVYHSFLNAFPDVVFEDEEPLVDGNRVAQLTTVVGTDFGGFMGVPPTGRHFRFRMVRLYTFDDGEITVERRIYDFTGLLVQIGVLKAKPA